jgi:glucose/arabinose dehydrogenase/mono/diheme cytochrome c family protein
MLKVGSFLQLLTIAGALVSATIHVARAQSGDREGEDQTPNVQIDSPPAPALSPEEAVKTLRVAPGFRVEIVAAEPLVFDPVAMNIDADGRMWVVEMRGYMPNVDGEGENAPTGTIAVLEDIDGDGRMDRRTEFAGGFVLPRAVLPVAGGALVAEPPNLWFLEDTDGDGKADRRTSVANDYGNSSNPEHAPNGLMWALDNWIYSANHTVRFRYDAGQWRRERTIFRGQWGIAQDDAGRLVYNTNSDPLRMDVLPAEYLRRNPNLVEPRGSNVQLASAQALPLWPSRVTLGVNRGYQLLRADGTLPTFTAACAPVIYRGSTFPQAFRGNAFIAEPAGNLVKRALVEFRDGVPTASNAYADTEFLTSSDERFRPVNLYNGPDGALYVVDMYRGVIQHRIFLTTYLRNQIKERGLEAPLGRGRIYRIVPDDAKRRAWPRLAQASLDTLVSALSHDAAWWRETAQRVLIERADARAIPLIRQTALTARSPLGRLHALWTLEGLNAADWPTLQRALNDKDVQVASAALRIAEPYLKDQPVRVIRQLAARAARGEIEYQRQLALSLGAVSRAVAEPVLQQLAQEAGAAPFMADAIASSLHGGEVAFFERLVADRAWSSVQQRTKPVLVALGAAILKSNDAEAIERLFAHLDAGSDRSALPALILDAAERFIPGEGATKRTAFLPAPPSRLLRLAEGRDVLAIRARELLQSLRWKGQQLDTQRPLVALTSEQQRRYETGREQFAVCAACHQEDGQGLDGLAPALVGSAWATGGADALIRIVLNGKTSGETTMPSLRALDDETIAAILTYVRRSWGHASPPISPAQVRIVRGQTSGRDDPWTDAELEPMR